MTQAKTSEKIIQDFTGKSDIEINQFIYYIAKDNFTLQTKNQKWFPANKSILIEDVEKMIDELPSYLYNEGVEMIKQELKSLGK